MKRRENSRPGYGRILDAWQPPDDAGEPLGCVATTFTFDPAFFEEECLSRFLALETAPEDGTVHLIEREEKLGQLVCAAVLADQHHARGSRNPRWDLLAARVPGGILHAKVSLLLWSRCARLIVASANLTEPGYRRNHEVFGVLDYCPGSRAPLSVLGDMVDFLRWAATFAASAGAAAGPALSRWNGFLDHVLKAGHHWSARGSLRSFSGPTVFAVTTGPGRPNAFRQLRRIWPEGSMPSQALVISPFFDPPGVTNKPVKELWGLLRRRAWAFVQFEVTGEDLPAGGVLLHAPESLRMTQPDDRDQAATLFRRLRLENGRSLHAKCVWVQDSHWGLYLMGSSNFTSAGLGLSKPANLEANLAFRVSLVRNAAASKAMKQAWLQSEEAKGRLRFLREPLDDRDDAPTPGDILLPKAFGEAVFGKDAAGAMFVELTFPQRPPPGWRLLLEHKDKLFFSESAWRKRRLPARVRLAWASGERPPSAFRVVWRGCPGVAWWPVNVRDTASLPPPAQLHALSLDQLIELVGSALPPHKVLRRWIRRANGDGTREVVIDPHRRVDTSAFLLQRTRRLSWALAALRERLSQPVPSRAALDWRLRGPCGVMALTRAILQEKGRKEAEKAFQLAEIAVELARVEPRHAPGCLPRPQVRAALRQCVREIRALARTATRGCPVGMKRYVKLALQEASA